MRPRTRLAFVIVLSVIASDASHVAAQKQPTTTVTRLYTGADGQSHAEDTEVAWRPARLWFSTRVHGLWEVRPYRLPKRDHHLLR